MKKLLPLLIAGALGVLLWRTSFFGFAVNERRVVFVLPVSYQAVRTLELQLWSEGALVERRLTSLPDGLKEEPELKVQLHDGAAASASAVVTLRDEEKPRAFSREFTVTGDVLRVEFSRP